MDSGKDHWRYPRDPRFQMPRTVDHVADGLGPADFVICSWRVNDAKNDLDRAEFLEVCRAVLAHSDAL
ncbi:MAG: hypothetical protein WD894_20460 [Pirellulales bacterium]